MLFATTRAELVGVVDANKLGQLRTGAASGVAAKHLARPGARTLGVIGCGWQAESQVACIRAAVPSIEHVIAIAGPRSGSRSSARRSAPTRASPTATRRRRMWWSLVTTARDPVLRGEWLQPGALVCAVGANDGRARELDNEVLRRAAFVCCDSLEQAQIESGDLIEPVEQGVLDWLAEHESHEVVAGEVQGRQSDADVIVFKSNGIAAWDVAAAAAVVERGRERGVGREL